MKDEASNHCCPNSISVIKLLKIKMPTPIGITNRLTNFWNLKNIELNSSLLFWSLDNDENRTGVVAAVIIDVWKMIQNVLPSTLAASAMLLILLLPSSESILQQFAYIFVCVCIYFIIIMMFPEERKLCLNLKSIIKR